MNDLKQAHLTELLQLRSELLVKQRREQELLAILATFDAIDARQTALLDAARSRAMAAPSSSQSGPIAAETAHDASAGSPP